MWMRIGSRSGPGHDRPVPTVVPTDWKDDHGQFIHANLTIVWRRGRWEKRFSKISKRDEIDFYFYGPGYSDYECKNEVVAETEFQGVE